MKTILLFLFLTGILLCSCDNKKTKVENNFIIKIQPFRGTDPSEVKEVADLITKYYPHVTVATTLDLPEFAFYRPRARYKADSLLKFLSALAKKNEILLGVTKTDISTQKGVISDWGVMGLGKCPGNSCVASSFRLNMASGKNQLFKVCIHELGHTMGLPHCPNLECYMRDANEGNPLDEENGFCSKCKRYLQERNWKLL
jgi:archaemetzincin